MGAPGARPDGGLRHALGAARYLEATAGDLRLGCWGAKYDMGLPGVSSSVVSAVRVHLCLRLSCMGVPGVLLVAERFRGHRGETVVSPPAPSQEAATLPLGAWHIYIPTWEDDEYRAGEEEVWALIKARGLRRISDFQEGYAASEADPGTFGYLHSSGSLSGDAGRLKLKQVPYPVSGMDTQIHRLADGTVEVIGFVSKQDWHAINSSKAETGVSIFNRRTSNAPHLVALPVDRIVSCRESSVRSSSHRFDIRLRPPTKTPSSSAAPS